MTSREKRSQVARAICDAKRVFLAAHENPDGDAIGSLLAMRLMLLSMDKIVHAAVPTPPPNRFAFLAGSEAIATTPPPFTADLAIALDCDGVDRLVDLRPAFETARLTIDIDHHRGLDRFGDLQWVVPDAPATAALVVELAHELEISLTPPLAQALYTGLIADTGAFRFTNTTPNALRIGAELIEAGADPADLARRVFSARPLSAALLEGRALSSLQMIDAGVLVASLSQRDFVETGASPADTDGVIDSFRDVLGAKVAVLIKETHAGFWQVSLRGNGVDVATVAAGFGGGGHRFASGFSVEGSREEVLSRILEALTPALDGGGDDA